MTTQKIILKDNLVLNLNEDASLILLESGKRINLEINLVSKDITVNALFLSTLKDREIKMDVFINHKAKNTKSYFLSKIIIKDNAKFDFSGNINLSKSAGESSGNLEVKTLIAGENASWRAKPNLFIRNKTSTASHKATLMRYNEQQILYLRSRGLNKEDAKDMLQQAFLKEDF